LFGELLLILPCKALQIAVLLLSIVSVWPRPVEPPDAP